MTYEIDAVGRSIVAQVAYKEACNVLGGEASANDLHALTQSGFDTIISVATGTAVVPVAAPVAAVAPAPLVQTDAGLQAAFPGAVPVNPGIRTSGTTCRYWWPDDHRRIRRGRNLARRTDQQPPKLVEQHR